MKLHTVVISYNRIDLTKQAIESYLETVTIPCSMVVVDNASTDGTTEWLGLLDELYAGIDILLLSENRYPGYATNRGFEQAPDDATHLHRADNDFKFLPGWCEHVEHCFRRRPMLGQLGLRTDEEECFAKMNVGGNMIIRRELWNDGLRYDERPWGEYPAGYSEDSFYSPEVVKMGWQWMRVDQPCIESLASGDLNDPYYQESYSKRGILVETIQEIQNRQALGIKEQP